MITLDGETVTDVGKNGVIAHLDVAERLWASLQAQYPNRKVSLLVCYKIVEPK